MKKFLALVMVGVMTMGMATMAADSPSASAVAASVPAAVQTAAAERNMSVAEYQNNAVAEIAECPTVEPAGVPSGCYVNGVKTNYSLNIAKPNKATTEAAKALATSVKGNVLSVMNLTNAPKGEVQFSIYCKSVAAGQKIEVYQLINGVWTKCVINVRAEHVDVKLAGNGPIVVVRK